MGFYLTHRKMQYIIDSMERGTISLNNLELAALQGLAIAQGCKKQDLINKLQPVPDVADPTQEHTVQISEDDAEIMLDCLPVPSESVDPNISSSRIKIQQFITKCRFGDEESKA